MRRNGNTEGDSRVAEPPLGGTIDHILTVLPSLFPSAQRVARLCVERPGDVVDMSGADLAAAAETSQATVSRTAYALGFRNFQHLRLLLVRDLGADAQQRNDRQEGTAGWLDAIAEGASTLIRSCLATIDTAEFEAAADAIAAAPRVLVVGTGGSLAPAQSVALSFALNGRPCEAPGDAVAQHLVAGLLTPGDVCLVVSLSGANAATLASAQAAASASATVIGVTSFAHAPVASYADYVLVAGARFQSWDEGFATRGLVQHLVLSVLQMAVAARMGDEAERARSAVRAEVSGLVLEPVDGRNGEPSHPTPTVSDALT